MNSVNPVSISPITYPARPVNGGPLDKALPKTGVWDYEPKYNGWRTMVHIATGTMFNRHGQPLSIEREFADALRLLCATLDAGAWEWVDCEGLERRHNIGRGTLIVLDVIPKPGSQWAGATYQERRSWITPNILPVLYPDKQPSDRTVYQTARIEAARAMEYWLLLQTYNRQLRCEFYEGLVAKRTDSKYPVQLRRPDVEFPFWVKHRWAW